MGEEEWAAGMQGDVHKSRVSRLLCLKPFFETIVKGWNFNSVKQAKMKKKKLGKKRTATRMTARKPAATYAIATA